MKTIKTWLTIMATLLCSITIKAYDIITNDNLCYNITSEINQEVECAHLIYADGPVTIPSTVSYNGVMYSVTSIGADAFSSSGLISINIPETVTSIGSRAFYSCGNLISINIPSRVTSIEENVFRDCVSLTSIDIPQKVTSIGDYAFCGCRSLSSITIPEAVTEIGEDAFRACINVVSINVPEGIKSIKRETFAECRSLAFITIPESVTNIEDNAFENCQNINSITIPKNVATISFSSFNYCNIKKVIWKCSTLPEGYSGIGAVNYTANSDYASYSGFKVYPMLGNMFEADGVTYVPTSMSGRTCDVVDYDCNRTATSVNIGPTVTYNNIEFTVNNVNDYAFYGNQYLEEVTFANQGSIGAYALSGCSELTSVNLAEGVTSIGENAFDACNKLASFALPASVTSLDKALFNGCNGLTAITVAAENTQYDSRNNCNAIIEKESNKLIAACSETLIPASVTAIGDYAFSACGKMTSITIHKDILSIGNYAFSGCSSLADVTIEDRTELLTLGSNGNKALFSDCPLTSVYIGGKISYNANSSYGYSPFSSNSSLSTVTITDKEDTIYPYEFYNCSTLKSVTIGDGVTTIGDYAFSGCTALEGFAFGCSMETIGTKAFLGCSKMTKVESGAVNPPVCGDNALDDLDKWNCTLYMPVGCKGAYQAADQWKEFLLMEDNIPIKKYTLTFMVDGNVYHTESLAYDEAVVLPDNPEREGYTFIEWEGLPQTMPSTDITVNASFAINEYTLTYIVDDEEYAKETVVYGATIEPKAVPSKEGHTFGGWSEIPETMPATDVTIIGSFTVNSYSLIYIIDGIVYDTKSVAYGTEIIMLEAPEKTGYTFDGWDKNLSVMPAEDVVINGSYTRLPIEDFVINDGNDSEFISEEDLQCEKITYTRTFTNTKWQALYVPFEIPVTEELLADFEVADLNNVHQYDRDDDGVTDETVIEAFKMTSGVLEANYPYLIRAKEAGEKSITVTDAVLYATQENSIDCSSVRDKFTFTGTYSSLSSAELSQGEGYYTLINGEWQPVTEDVSLGAFRFYLKVDSRSGAPAAEARSIRMRIIGENGEDDATGIENSTGNGQQATVYDLQGRKVLNTDNLKGIYIVDGKKVVIK